MTCWLLYTTASILGWHACLPGPRDCGIGMRRFFKPGAAEDSQRPGLLDLGAAPLNQNDQNDYKKHSGNNPDNHRVVHSGYLLSLVIERRE